MRTSSARATVERQHDGGCGEREVSGANRELRERANAPAGVRGNCDGDDRLAGSRLVVYGPQQKLPDRDVPRNGERANVHRRVEREERHRELGGRVGVS